VLQGVFGRPLGDGQVLAGTTSVGDVVLAGSEDFTLWMWLAQSGNCMQVKRGGGAVTGCLGGRGRGVAPQG
jgi:hypothetical protein